MKAFIVNSKDLFNKKKNPNLSLSAKDILKNNKIIKERLKMKTIKKVKVRNMKSYLGNAIPNQFIIETDDGIYFQSYNSIIAFKRNGRVFLDDNYWGYSVTTGKYRNIFLNETKKETEKKIKMGVYQLVNLNK